jgi:hypothetical protein
VNGTKSAASIEVTRFVGFQQRVACARYAGAADDDSTACARYADAAGRQSVGDRRRHGDPIVHARMRRTRSPLTLSRQLFIRSAELVVQARRRAESEHGERIVGDQPLELDGAHRQCLGCGYLDPQW